jgi:tetratricopeptide (TPR) repeat protein
MRRFYWTLSIFIPTILIPAYATETHYPSDSELLSLPKYCQVKLRQKPGDAGYNYWQGILGPDYLHTHHFCQGLNEINRYYKAETKYDREYYLGVAIGELGYMIAHASPTYSLMPEVYLNRGFAFSKLGKDGEAIIEYQKAIHLNSRLPRAYSMIADYYTERNLRDKALATITEGLKQVPDSKMLQRRYLELGGKKPFPEPYKQLATEEKASAEKTTDAPAKQSGDAVGVTTNEQAPQKTEPVKEQSSPPPVIGTPENPYCRFCPDLTPAKQPAGNSASPGGPPQ